MLLASTVNFVDPQAWQKLQNDHSSGFDLTGVGAHRTEP